jgi:hypothetical protein
MHGYWQNHSSGNTIMIRHMRPSEVSPRPANECCLTLPSERTGRRTTNEHLKPKEYHVNCPSCNEKISWNSIFLFTNIYTKRLKADCPHCRRALILIKWPLRTFNVASFLLLGAMATLSMSAFEIFEQKIKAPPLLFTLSGILFLIVAKSKKLKKAKPSLAENESSRNKSSLT